MALISHDLQYLEQRYSELRAKLVQRRAQQTLPASEGVYRDASPFINSLAVEVHSVASQLVALKYDPIEVIETMESKR